jgi:hypothetical protein
MKTTDHLQTGHLVREYKKGRSASSLAREFKVSVWSVIERLRSAGVKVRPPEEQNARYLKKSSAEFTFREVVDGILLGDGQVDPKGILHLDQSNVRKGWAKQVKDHLEKTGCSSKLLPIPPRIRVIEGRKVTSKPATHLYTPSYREMHAERKRWYPNGFKEVPRDLRLTPLVLNHWFCGDGTYNTNGHLTICTNDFWEADIDFLVERLAADLDVYSCKGNTGREGQFIIRFDRHDETMKLKAILDPIIPKCCRYKLRFVRSKKRMRRFSDKQVLEIRKRRVRGETLFSLAKKFKVSASAISNIANGKVYKEVK